MRAEDGPVPADFFVLRTPLLPIDTLHAFSEGLEAPAAVGTAGLAAALRRDAARLRERLRALLLLPEVREALFVASPSLDESLPQWEQDPEGERGQKVERTLVRYLARMAGRPTPFGLFAGCAVGTVGDRTHLRLAPRGAYRKHTRLDGDYLSALCEALGRDPAIRAALSYRPNTSLYRAAGQLRYAEARLADKMRSYHLIAVEESPYLAATLARAAGGARPAELAQALCADDPDIDQAEAAAYVEELIASQLLMPALTPAVTGPEPIHGLVAELTEAADAAGGLADRAAAALASAREALSTLDGAGPGAARERYQQIARDLEALPAKVELARLFQVDLVKPAPECVLGRDAVAEIRRAVERLHRTSGEHRVGALDRFREEFQKRYEAREVPLWDALDEESGIGFAASNAPGAEAAPLLEGLLFPAGRAEPGAPLGRRERVLLPKLSHALASGAREIALTDDDWKALEEEEAPPPLPDSFAVLATVLAAGPGAAAEGDFRLHLRAVHGPSGASLLGRFCHGDEALSERVRRHLRAEEALRPDALFAEIVHLPEGRIGNVLLRPLLRGYEIPFLGRSGAAPERLLPLTDLLVSVRGGRVVLRSARLGAEVVPRLTTAHNFASPHNLGAYRFLCALQGQGLAGGLSFSWGALDGAPYLPRVVSGRLVLSPARWNLRASELRPVLEQRAAARYQALQELRRAVGLPRHCAVVDGDNLLPLDLDNVLSVETAAQLLRERQVVTLTESLHGEEDVCAEGPEGRFVHELVVPLLRRAPEAAPPAPVPGPRRGTGDGATQRRFLPGSEWLYAKIYTGTARAEQVLHAAVGPVVRQALADGAARGWFFIRYSDPDWHLRLRLRGEPRRLLGEVLPNLHAALGPLLADGRVWRLQLDSYEREVERYGGPAGIELSEALFQADSEAALRIVEQVSGDEGAEARWRLCLRGMDQLLADLGLDLEGRHEVVRRAREGFGQEFGLKRGALLERQLGERFRRERRALEALLSAAPDADQALAPGLLALEERSRQIRPIAAALQAAPLTAPLDVLGVSYLHMYANRLLRSAARAQELVLYDFLDRLYESQRARQRRGPAPRA